MPTTLIERPQPDMGLDQASDKTLSNVEQPSLSIIGHEMTSGDKDYPQEEGRWE